MFATPCLFVDIKYSNDLDAMDVSCSSLLQPLWSSFVVLFPMFIFEKAGLPAPNYPEIWQCVGMIVDVYGVGYWIASSNPLDWPIVLVGLLGKV